MRILLALLLSVLSASAATSYYIDPDYSGGSNDGSQAHPWNSISSGYTSINTSLGSGDVTVYFSALKANGVTQQSSANSMDFQRKVAGTNRVTYDGYSFYNSNTSTPNWKLNPNPSIASAYVNHQVYLANVSAGWSRADGGQSVTVSAVNYTCIRTHVSAASTQPGVGVDWRKCWAQWGGGGPAWSSGVTYWTLTRQDYTTIRGFEMTGANHRWDATGDNLVDEYLYGHDNIGANNVACLYIDYTSYPDDATSQIVMAPCTNMLVHDVKFGHTTAEVMYLGCVNPDAPITLQATNGNQHSYVTISNFFIYEGGAGGGQGDGIDVKNGFTHFKMTTGTITNCASSGGTFIPQSLDTSVDQDYTIENVIISGIYNSGQDQIALNGVASGLAGTTKGYNGVTVRNCVINDSAHGIEIRNSGGAVVKNVSVYNTLVHQITNDFGLDVELTGGTAQITNCIVYHCNSDGTQNTFSGSVNMAYNAFGGGSWGGTSPNNVSGVVDGDFVDAAHCNFNLLSPSVREYDAGTTLSTFNYDLLGVVRPQAFKWDIGPYEFKAFIPVITNVTLIMK